MKYSTESFIAYILVILFAGVGMLPIIALAASSTSLLTVLAVSPLSFYAAVTLYGIEEKRERMRRRKAMRLRTSCQDNPQPLRAA